MQEGLGELLALRQGTIFPVHGLDHPHLVVDLLDRVLELGVEDGAVGDDVAVAVGAVDELVALDARFAAIEQEGPDLVTGGDAAREIQADAAQELGIGTWAQYFLKFVVSHPAVTVAIPGTSKARHMLDNQQAGRGMLPDATMREQMFRYLQNI
mgnify:CR=1 FL=1